jgi:hypothetical protein
LADFSPSGVAGEMSRTLVFQIHTGSMDRMIPMFAGKNESVIRATTSGSFTASLAIAGVIKSSCVAFSSAPQVPIQE